MDIWLADCHIIDLTIIILAGLLHAMLQLGLGCAMLLYHGSVGRRHVPKRTNMLVSSFIAGVGLAALVLLAAFCYFVANLGTPGPLTYGILVILLLVVALATLCFYYRPGDQNSTELWLPRPVAHFLDRRAHETKSSTEAYLLGTMSCFGELPFSLPLIILAAAAALRLPSEFQLVALAVYVILVALPLIIFRLIIRRRTDLLAVQRFRRRSKNFLRLAAASGYIILAVFVFVFQVLELR